MVLTAAYELGAGFHLNLTEACRIQFLFHRIILLVLENPREQTAILQNISDVLTLSVFHMRLQVKKPHSRCSRHFPAHLLNMDEVLSSTIELL